MQHLRLMSLWTGHRALLTALILAGAAVAATWTGQALLTSRIFTALVAGAPLSDPSLLPFILALAAVLLVRPLLLLARQLLAQHAMTRVKSTLRSQALSAFVRRSALDPAAGRTGRDHAVVVDGIENLDAYLSGYLPQACVTVLVVGAVGTTMIVVDPITGTIAVSAALLLPLLPRLWDRVLAARGADHWEAYQELHAEFVDSMRGMTTLVAFGADRRREDQLARASQHLLARTLGQLRISLVESGLSGFALAAVPALVLGVVIARRQDLGAFEIFILVLLSVELVRPLRDLAALWHAGYLGTFSGPRVMDLLDATAPSRSGTAVASRPRVEDGEVEQDGPGAVVVRGVTAHYPRAENPALNSIDLRIGPGLTAIVGATGSGKSTLAAVLVGLLAPDSGSVGINGTVCDPDALLERVSLVPQDPVLLGDTVGQDIALGLPDRAEPHHQRLDADIVAWAASTAGIGTDDGALSLESPVGQDGALLSGGQRQRVALARALAQQREILILDEATSALDPASETRLVAALRRNAGAADGDAEGGSSRGGAAPTVIAITHRLAVAIGADHVVVLQQGRVVEQGPPRQLLARRGALSALVEAESSRRADAASGTERGPDPALATAGGAREGADR